MGRQNGYMWRAHAYTRSHTPHPHPHTKAHTRSFQEITTSPKSQPRIGDNSDSRFGLVTSNRDFSPFFSHPASVWACSFRRLLLDSIRFHLQYYECTQNMRTRYRAIRVHVWASYMRASTYQVQCQRHTAEQRCGIFALKILKILNFSEKKTLPKRGVFNALRIRFAVHWFNEWIFPAN